MNSDSLLIPFIIEIIALVFRTKLSKPREGENVIFVGIRTISVSTLRKNTER